MFFKFATRYVLSHKDLPSAFVAGDSTLGEFQRFINEQKFTYQEEGETKVKELSDIADKAKYSSALKDEIAKLKKQLETEKTISPMSHKSEILPALRIEIMSRYKGERGRIEASLTDDAQIKTATGLLENREEYSRRLSLK
ncbi:MAG: hypothetical protein HYR76_00685 [Ignavibacteria bacterium]|nr:hypothetical protein [Ignavibacteria bacterium]